MSFGGSSWGGSRGGYGGGGSSRSGGYGGSSGGYGGSRSSSSYSTPAPYSYNAGGSFGGKDNFRDRFGGGDHSFSDLRDLDYNQVKDKVSIAKDFYRETKKTAERSRDEIEHWRRDNEIQIEDPDCRIKPILDFNELDVPGALTDAFRKQNYQTPTPIQAQSWPIALRGQDVIGIARTGSGKTLGFLLPALVHIR